MSEPVSEWERYRAEFFRRCEAIYRQRGDDYNRQTDIREYWIYGISSIFHCIWAKTLRLKSLLSPGLYEIKKAYDQRPFEDSLFDIVNYASFAYAENKCRTAVDNHARHVKAFLKFARELEEAKQDELKIRRGIADAAKVTDCDLGPSHAEPAGGDVERVVLEPGSQTAASIPSGSDHPFSPLHEACPSCTEYAEGSGADIGRCHVDMGAGEHSAQPSRTDRKDT